MSASDAGEDKDQPEEAEAMQSCNGAVRFEPVHRSESGQDVDAEAKQPGDIT